MNGEEQQNVASAVEGSNAGDGNEITVAEQPNIRRDFYQTDSDFVLNIMAKNVDPKQVQVSFGPQTLEVKAKLPEGQDYELKANLFAPIRPDFCSYQVTRTKIEIRLRKDTATSWPALEHVQKKEAPPTYPSSSKAKKDWSKVEKDIEAETKDDESDINNLFAKIYNSGDEDMKKAMMKSMQESGGTVLSTNWGEVGKKKVDISPPDGMEWKKWE